LLYKDIIEFGDRKFLLYLTVRETPKIDADILKQYWNCDTVLKKITYITFVMKLKK